MPVFCTSGVSAGLGMAVNMTPSELAEKLRFFRDNNIIGLYSGGGYNWGLMGPTYYTYGKLIGNPDRDPRKLVREYCRGVYGKAGNTMSHFFELLYSRSFPKTGQYLDRSYQMGMTNEDRYLFIYPPEFLQRCDGLLQVAEKQAKTPRARNWLRLTRDHFDYVRHVSDMFTLYRAYRARPNRENLFQLKEAVEAFDKFRMRVLFYEDAYTRDWFPAHHMFSNFLTSGGVSTYYLKDMSDRKARIRKNGIQGLGIGFHRTGIREPITLDFDALLKAKGPARISAVSINEPVKVDGLLDEGVWAHTKPQSLKPLAGKSDISTTVRLLYDTRHLYVAYECSEPNMAGLKAAPTGRDGRVYDLDAVDTFISTGDITKRHQFMAAPAKDAFYDARLGFLGEKRDKGWNPRWDYGFSIDKQNKRWTMELAIPFVELGEKTPETGTTWRANFCRVRRAGGTRPDAGDTELFMWSPSTKASFADPSAMGEIRFEQ